MATDRRLYRVLFASCVLLLFPPAVWWSGGWDRVIAADSSGRTKAQALVAAYAKHVGAHDAIHQTLDADNDRSFGDFGFHYFPQRNVLQARVFILSSHRKDRPDRAKYEKEVDASLNDPKLGGMYDRGGGYFFFDEGKQITFLAKDYNLATITSADFIRDVDNLKALGGVWVMSWFAHLAAQTFGAEPLPTQPITRENDPYKRR